MGETDADGKPFDGVDSYVMHFPAEQLPPVDGFWSLTMYDDQYFFAPNKLDRYTLSARNALNKNADGSVDLYLQANSPGGAKESNWLPTTQSGKFIPMLRLYWPKENAGLDPRRHLEAACDPESGSTVSNYSKSRQGQNLASLCDDDYDGRLTTIRMAGQVGRLGCFNQGSPAIAGEP